MTDWVSERASEWVSEWVHEKVSQYIDQYIDWRIAESGVTKHLSFCHETVYENSLILIVAIYAKTILICFHQISCQYLTIYKKKRKKERNRFLRISKIQLCCMNTRLILKNSVACWFTLSIPRQPGVSVLQYWNS